MPTRPALRTALCLLGVVMTPACAGTLRGLRDFSPHDCPAGLAASFLQLSERELALSPAEWQQEMQLLRSVGARTVIVQFTGDERGAFDTQRPAALPVRRLIESADAAGIRVWLGLYANPQFPQHFDFERQLPAPLDDPTAAAALVALCKASPACEGIYLSPEIDDHRGLGDTRRILTFLSRTAAALRALAPDLRLAIAPFFSGKLGPADHAAFWRPLLAADLIDVFMLQDGVGTGRATPKTARLYLQALREVIPARSGRRGPIELWSVVELFRQLAGPPHDERPFVATPAAFEVISRSLIEEGAIADRLVGFAVADYMDPRRSDEAARLYDEYQRWCKSRRVAHATTSMWAWLQAESDIPTKEQKKEKVR